VDLFSDEKVTTFLFCSRYLNIAQLLLHCGESLTTTYEHIPNSK